MSFFPVHFGGRSPKSPVRLRNWMESSISRWAIVKKPITAVLHGSNVMAICRVCGRGNADDARFCFSCGAAVSAGPSLTPPVKVEVKSPLTGLPPSSPSPMVPPIYTPRNTSRPGTCYYHAELPSSFVCSRCGRSICAGCNKQYGMLNFCPECYWGLAPKIGYSPNAYQQSPMPYPSYPQQEQSHSLWPF